MLAAERQNQILQRSQAEGAVRTTGLARDFGVTEETIRRDLEKMADAGLVQRIHGGATALDFAGREFTHTDREVLQREEKQAIARVAAAMIQPHETIFLDASSTALQLAWALPEALAVRVVTYSLPVIERLQNHGNVELVSLGGTYQADGRRFGGLLVEQNLASFGVDRFFFSGKGFREGQGVSEANEEQASLKQFALRYANWSALLLDRTKLGISSNYFFARVHELSAIISDSEAAPFFRASPLPDSCQLYLAPINS